MERAVFCHDVSLMFERTKGEGILETYLRYLASIGKGPDVAVLDASRRRDQRQEGELPWLDEGYSPREPEDPDDLEQAAASLDVRAVEFAAAQYGLGPEDAFGLDHEAQHDACKDRAVYSAFLQSYQAGIVRNLLKEIAQVQELSSVGCEKLWQRFFHENRLLVELVNRFRAIEEVFANFFALGNVADDLRGTILRQVHDAMARGGIDQLYIRMAELAGQTGYYDGDIMTQARMILLMELTAVVLAHTRNVNPHEAVEIAVAAWDAREPLLAGDPGALAPRIRRICPDWGTNLIEEVWTAGIQQFAGDLQRWHAEHPRIALMDFRGELLVISDERAGLGKEISFWESVRQQVSQACGLSCPYAAESKPYCGRAELLVKLWRRLPDKYRSEMASPACTTI